MVTTSAARIEANRKNAQMSTGPRTEAGKAVSRMNALKHGLSGDGAVLTDAVAAEVQSRNEALQKEMAPKTTMGALLIKQIALMSVRSEKCADQAIAANAEFVRHSKERFDEARVEKAEELWETIEQNPRGNLRKLRQLPEGVELMEQVWEDLRLDLTREGAKPTWTAAHMVKAANLTGFNDRDSRNSPFGRLSRPFGAILRTSRTTRAAGSRRRRTARSGRGRSWSP